MFPRPRLVVIFLCLPFRGRGSLLEIIEVYAAYGSARPSHACWALTERGRDYVLLSARINAGVTSRKNVD